MQYAPRQEQESFEEFEDAFDSHAEKPQGQQDQPHDGIEDECQECNRPAQDEENEPGEESQHEWIKPPENEYARSLQGFCILCPAMQTLEEVLDHGPLSPADATRITAEIGSAVHSMHVAGECHLGVCPRAVTLDRHMGAHLMAAAHVGPQPIAYCSPENLDGLSSDWRSDLWSLGVLYYRMLAGVEPFQGIDEEGLRVAIRHQRVPEFVLADGTSPRAMAFLNRCLSRDLNGRHADLSEVRRDLEDLRRIPESGSPGSAGGGARGRDPEPAEPFTPEIVTRVREARLRAAEAAWAAEAAPIAVWKILVLPVLVLLGMAALLYWWIGYR